MDAGGESRHRRLMGAGVVLIALLAGAAGCGSGSSGSDATNATTTSTAPASTTTAPATSTSGGSTTGTSGSASTSTTAAPSSGLPGATEAQHSAPGDGTGTALLRTVRVGRNDGFERIVFEFAGDPKPGYRIQWVDGPILADGSGEVVDVAGDAHLEIVMDPASGVDLSAPQLTVVYNGPDRIPVAGQTELITDLVRTGDFESVLSWAAGTTEQVPFRVMRLEDPTRVVVDLQTP